jgi:hypothetical protein
MNHKVGIWIDHEKAVIVFASGDRVTMTTLESKVGLRPRSSDRAGDPAADGARDGRSKKKYEGDYGRLLDRYYDEVVRLMACPEALLIFGPGEAKLQLKERLSRSRGLCDRIVGIHTTEALTNPQIVAKVREHYGIHRSPGTGGLP